MLDFLALANECAPNVAPQTLAAIVRVESGFNPYAIGLVGGRLTRQPGGRDEAIATVKALETAGWNFSVGVAQINRYNLPRYKLTYEQAFDACANLRVGAQILQECYLRAMPRAGGDEQVALRAAFSCYYSGNFRRGFLPDRPGGASYVERVLAQAAQPGPAKPIPVVPTVKAETTAPPSPPAPKKPAPHHLVPDGDGAVLLRRADDPGARAPASAGDGAKNPVFVF